MTHLLSLSSFAPDAPNLPKMPETSNFWLPLTGSTLAESYDWLFNFVMWLSIISLILVMGAMAYFVVKYRAASRKEKPEPSTDHHTGLELAWSILPMFPLVAVFVWGFQGFIAMRTTPKDAYEVHVTAQKWKWLFEYDNGYSDDTLHVPVGRKVRVVINSVDVLHSFYLPVFRQKIDAVPGRYTELWFEPTQAGDFPIFCAEYCGTNHSNMLSHVIVHPSEEDFNKWLDEAGKIIEQLPAAELGAKMYAQNGCSGCHSTDGSILTGPSFKGLFGKTETLSDGSSVTVDENYIRNSILEPQSQLVKGFPPAMPTFKGKLSDKKIDGLIAFIKAQQ